MTTCNVSNFKVYNTYTTKDGDGKKVTRTEKMKLHVTFHTVKLDNYVPRSTTFSILKVNGKSKFIKAKTNRTGVVAVVRLAYTGVPFCGLSILHPIDKGVYDPEQGKAIALRRAFTAFEKANHMRPGLLWSLYRLESAKVNNPTRYAEIIKKMTQHNVIVESREAEKAWL